LPSHLRYSRHRKAIESEELKGLSKYGRRELLLVAAELKGTKFSLTGAAKKVVKKFSKFP
jgi:hypothetical protein